MIKKIGSFLIILSCVLQSETMKFHYHTIQDIPVTVAIRDVLEQISSERYQELALAVKQQRPLLERSVFDVQLLQALTKQLSEQSTLSYQDIEKIKTIVDTMKDDVVGVMQQQKPYSRQALQQSLYELSHNAMAMLDSLSARQIDDDLFDLKQMFVQAQQLLEDGQSDKKLIVRMLSVINEIFQKYDELFVSAYDVIMLSHVALIIFFMGSL